mmetsp:Transcript_39771/g.120124  ORF Transcript_39771/g.120124 Transcript_39771/m.120124 type:complete len:89 (-) Transcript_39771:195-461(-)
MRGYSALYTQASEFAFLFPPCMCEISALLRLGLANETLNSLGSGRVACHRTLASGDNCTAHALAATGDWQRPRARLRILGHILFRLQA